MDGLLVYVVVLVILIAFSAFFSGSEAALFSLNRSQISRLEGQSGAGRLIATLLASPRRLLISILIGNLIANVFSTSAATSLFVRMFGGKGVGIAFVFMSALIMIFGEIVPKAVMINRPQRYSLLVIYPVSFFNFIFYPIGIPIVRLADAVIEFLKKRLGAARSFFSKEELLTAFDIGRDEGYMGEFEYDLMSNIMEFRDTVVKEIMTPSISVFSLSIDMKRDEMEERILQSGFSRVPIYGETPDDIQGVLHIKDLAAAPEGDIDIRSILRPPYYVPEPTKISELFKELAARRSHLATVIDEYGSFVGIVTMEDVLEELVGEIRDSKESRAEEYTLLDERRIVLLGTMEIDEFNGIFGENVADDEHETVAGYVTGVTGSIPQAGETIDIGALRFHIISAQPNRIRKMRVEKI